MTKKQETETVKEKAAKAEAVKESEKKPKIKSKTNVLFVSFEATPFMKTGGLGDVSGTLPGFINNARFDVRVMLPKLDIIPEKFLKKMEFVTSYAVNLSWRWLHCGLFRLKYKGVWYYFLDNEYYFGRGAIYGEFDDGERMAYFSKAALESVRYIPDFTPDIIHCNDWHTALVPVYLREKYMRLPEFAKMKTVFTIHNLKFQGQFTPMMLGDVLGLWQSPAADQLMMGDAVNYLKGAVIYSDAVTTVSPAYAAEIRTAKYGEGLSRLFRAKGDSLKGILNGIDYKEYNPETDKLIPCNYSAARLAGKKKDKLALQEELGLPVNADVPLIAMISRLTPQKGLDVVCYALEEIAGRDLQFAVLGLGEKQYEDRFRYMASARPDKISARIEFSAELSHRIYAGADAFLMPSRFEPCGLSQMMAMRYGTVPIVRETGGLKDTVTPYNYDTGEGDGVTFTRCDSADLMGAIDRALGLYYDDKRAWRRMQKAAMAKDFSWKSSAVKYRELYASLLG